MKKFVEKSDRAIAGLGISRVVRCLKNSDREKTLLDLADLGQKLAKGLFQDSTFDKIRDVIRDRDSKWMQFLYQMMDETDAHVMKTMTWNLGYTALFRGCRRIRRNREKYGCNIPWGVLIMTSDSPEDEEILNGKYVHGGKNCQLSYEHMDKIIRQGKELGIYFYNFISYGSQPRAEDIVRLARVHRDCEFNLFTPGARLDKAFIRKMVQLGNITVSLTLRGNEQAMNSQFGAGAWEQTLSVMDYMREQGLIFGVESFYTSENYKEVTDDRFLDTIISHGARFIWYSNVRDLDLQVADGLEPTEEQSREMMDRIRAIRRYTGGKSIYAIDFLKDAAVVEGHTTGGMSYCLINASGEMVLDPTDPNSECFDLTRYSFLDGLKAMEKIRHRKMESA